MQKNASGPPQPQGIASNAFSAPLVLASSDAFYDQQQSYGMTPMDNALLIVDYQSTQYSQPAQLYLPATSLPVIQQIPYNFPHGDPLPGMGQGFYVPQPQMPYYYTPGRIPSGQGPMPTSQNLVYYPNQMINHHPQPGLYYAQTNHIPRQSQNMPLRPGQYVPSRLASFDAQKPHPLVDCPGMPVSAQKQACQEALSSRQTKIRGPPRKARQSGHAIWIGNLPRQTDLMVLAHHICKETIGLESLFLISKSKCAFANFKDENTCLAAQRKLHKSKFQSVILVSRLRKKNLEKANGLAATPGPATSHVGAAAAYDDSAQHNPAPGAFCLSLTASQATKPKTSPCVKESGQNDTFFILKSLTTEDLELSVQTGIWATQSHNEEALNNALKSCNNVYLILSANKSHEYFGYARMLSEVNDDPAAAIELSPNSLDSPRVIPVDATKHVPKGRIVDDSVRGTIFWEAEREDAVSESDNMSEASTKSGGTEDGTKPWGKPFKLEWLSISRLPFYQTQGLRNPWNSNREVKIARDGTELEPSVGRRLIGLFNRVQTGGPASSAMHPHLPMIHGCVKLTGSRSMHR
ncbi:hypothetical protein CDD83_7688 [Cordyceps sp. RAO-2017]|nr:hypothetical protein CDD83_7688 [Cordyceps sp. RAO-2017]